MWVQVLGAPLPKWGGQEGASRFACAPFYQYNASTRTQCAAARECSRGRRQEREGDGEGGDREEEGKGGGRGRAIEEI